MQQIVTQIDETADFLKGKGITQPKIAIVLGTGLSELIKAIKIIITLDYNEIPNFVTSTVEFHKGKLIYGTIGDKYVLAMQGRFHYYEGYSMQQITFPVRVFKALGVASLLLSNAAGGMNHKYKKGDLVLLKDHINLLPENPLRGYHDPSFGQRFVDMCNPYSKELNTRMKTIAGFNKVTIYEGVYVAVQGPNLETRAEYQYLNAAGADMVGMSTVPEVIVANQVGIPCMAVSVITDECDPDTLQPVNITEIIAVAGKADIVLSQLFVTLISQL
jgi:purine-nucleoside phosphorylase